MHKCFGFGKNLPNSSNNFQAKVYRKIASNQIIYKSIQSWHFKSFWYMPLGVYEELKGWLAMHHDMLKTFNSTVNIFKVKLKVAEQSINLTVFFLMKKVSGKYIVLHCVYKRSLPHFVRTCFVIKFYKHSNMENILFMLISCLGKYFCLYNIINISTGISSAHQNVDY